MAFVAARTVLRVRALPVASLSMRRSPRVAPGAFTRCIACLDTSLAGPRFLHTATMATQSAASGSTSRPRRTGSGGAARTYVEKEGPAARALSTAIGQASSVTDVVAQLRQAKAADKAQAKELGLAPDVGLPVYRRQVTPFNLIGALNRCAQVCRNMPRHVLQRTRTSSDLRWILNELLDTIQLAQEDPKAAGSLPSSRGLENAVRAIASVLRPHPSPTVLLSLLTDLIIKDLASFSVRDLSSVMHIFARTRLLKMAEKTMLFQHVAPVVVERCREANLLDATSLLQAYAVVLPDCNGNRVLSDLYDHLGHRVVALLDDPAGFNARAATGAICAFADSDAPCAGEVLAALVPTLRANLPRFKTFDIVKCLSSLHDVEAFAPQLLEEAAAELVTRTLKPGKLPGVDCLTPQLLAKLLEVYAEHHHEALGQLVVDELCVLARTCDVQTFMAISQALRVLTNPYWAWPRQPQPEAMLHNLTVPKAAQSLALDTTAWAVARLRHPDRSVMEAIAEIVVARVSKKELSRREVMRLAALSWAMASARVPSRALTNLALSARPSGHIPAVALRQLYQVHLNETLPGPDGGGAKSGSKSSGLAPALIDAGRTALAQSEHTFYARLLGQLNKLQFGTGVVVGKEADEGYVLPVALVSSKVALDFDGYTKHAGDPQRPAATTMFRRRQLERAGWTVVPIPYDVVEANDNVVQTIQEELVKVLSTTKSA